RGHRGLDRPSRGGARARLPALQRSPEPRADGGHRVPPRARGPLTRGGARRGEAAPPLRAVHAGAGDVLRAARLEVPNSLSPPRSPSRVASRPRFPFRVRLRPEL